MLRDSTTGQKLAANEKQHDHACFCRIPSFRRFSLDANPQRLAAVTWTDSPGCESHRPLMRDNLHCFRQL